jgi:hypothetical protein
MGGLMAKIREHQYEMGVSGRLMRARAVEEQLCDIEHDLVDRWERLQHEDSNSFSYGINKKMIIALVAERKKLIREFEYALSILLPKKNQHKGVTDAEIERARIYPISDLIEVKRNLAQCVSGTHQDKNPSMDCRNNFAYCYSCKWSGDSISVYQKIHGASFVDAVKALQ